jgi:hypothetical protein
MTSRPRPLSAKARKRIKAEMHSLGEYQEGTFSICYMTAQELHERIRDEVAAQMARRVFVMRAK